MNTRFNGEFHKWTRRIIANIIYFYVLYLLTLFIFIVAYQNDANNRLINRRIYYNYSIHFNLLHKYRYSLFGNGHMLYVYRVVGRVGWDLINLFRGWKRRKEGKDYKRIPLERGMHWRNSGGILGYWMLRFGVSDFCRIKIMRADCIGPPRDGCGCSPRELGDEWLESVTL